MEGNCQVNDAVYKCDVIRTLLKKMYLGLAGGNGKAVSITTSYHLHTTDIPLRQHFRVTWATWKVF